MEYQFHTLANGIRIVHRQTGSSVSHCGLMVNTGSRDEQAHESGMAHFIEHMIFKGTGKRRAYHVLSRIENVGGDLNAFTTKEETCIYASFLNPYYAQCLDLFADIAFNSTFPQKEIRKEKDVIIDEINSYHDSPAELIFDDFENLIFSGHPLGRNILGETGSVSAFKRRDIFRFINRNYSTHQMVIASVGNISFKRLVRTVEKQFGDARTRENGIHRNLFTDYRPRNVSLLKASFLAHAVVGNLAYARDHRGKMPLSLLTNLLGGPSLNSRLNLSIREKHGYAYAVEANYQPYSDTGVFTIYVGADRNHIGRSLDLIGRELKLMRDRELGTVQLHRAKKQVIGQLALSYESGLNEMLSVAKNHLHDTSIRTYEQLAREIELITAAQLQEVANEIFHPGQISRLIYEAKEDHD